jgi:hypothetical protein
VSDIAEKLLAAIAKRMETANADDLSNEESWHTIQCGYRQREWGELCECGVPDQVKADCAADRETVEEYQLYASVDIDTLSEYARGVRAGLDNAIRRLARGYGLEETG